LTVHGDAPTMQESWVNLYCTSCGESWEERVSDLPTDNGGFVCSHCDHEAHVKEFLNSDRDLEVYDELQ
jgi:transcription elongation factor Elf1